MSTQTTANALCARNLPQHFNGCACVADGSVTGEADVWLDISPDLPADETFETETPTVRVHGVDYEVIHLGGDQFAVDIDGKRVPFEADALNDDLVEEGAMLAADAHLNRQWGTVNVNEGSRTPWGAADAVERVAPGIVVAHTPGHGGIKLSPERNAEIPAALRQKSGWYEEDCEAQIVGMYFPEAFPHYKGADVADADQNEWRRGQFEGGVKSWFPDEYTKATGNPVSIEESSVLRDRAKQADKDAFRVEHANDFVSDHGMTGSSMSNKWIPEGHAVVEAVQESTGQTRHFLVPKDLVIHDGMWGTPTVIDPNRALDVTSVFTASKAPDEDRKPITGDDLVIDYSGLTGRNREAAYKELEQSYRWDDGTYSFGERLRREGVTDKKLVGDSYFVTLASGSGYKIKKSTFEALTTVPNAATDLDRARSKVSKAVDAVERIPRYDTARRQAAEARLQAARDEAKAVETADKAANPLKHWEGIEAARTAEFERIISERGISFD